MNMKWTRTALMQKRNFFPRISKRFLQRGLFCLWMGTAPLAHSATYGGPVVVQPGYHPSVLPWGCQQCIIENDRLSAVMTAVEIDGMNLNLIATLLEASVTSPPALALGVSTTISTNVHEDTYPRIAQVDSETAITTWIGTDDRVYMSVGDRTTNTWSPEEQVDSNILANTNVQVDADGNGFAMITWEDASGILYARPYLTDSGLGSVTILDGVNTAERLPQVSVSSGMAMVCAVANDSDARYIIEAHTYAQATDTWASPMTLGSSAISTFPEFNITSDASANFLFAFTGQRNGNHGVYSRTIFADNTMSSLSQVSLPMATAPHDIRLETNDAGQGAIGWIESLLNQERYVIATHRILSNNRILIAPPIAASEYETAVPHANLASTVTGNFFFNYAAEGRQLLNANSFLAGKAGRRGVQPPVEAYSTTNLEIRNPVIGLLQNTGVHLWEEGEGGARVITAQAFFLQD